MAYHDGHGFYACMPIRPDILLRSNWYMSGKFVQDLSITAFILCFDEAELRGIFFGN